MSELLSILILWLLPAGQVSFSGVTLPPVTVTTSEAAQQATTDCAAEKAAEWTASNLPHAPFDIAAADTQEGDGCSDLPEIWFTSGHGLQDPL